MDEQILSFLGKKSENSKVDLTEKQITIRQMNFVQRPIQNPKKPFPPVLKWILIGLVLAATFWGGVTAVRSGVLGEKVRRVVSLNPLKTDTNGHTNLLLLGVAGEMEQGGHLSDSIMIVSINPTRPSISVLSLPRDLYVSSKVGDRKINEVYAAAQYKHGEAKGLEVTKDAISKFTGIEIHYAAVVDFALFEDGIDLLGGVDVFVPQDINDEHYPDTNFGYQTFVVRRGLQHFSGDMALKYARSRKTTSDYDRARRQQDLALSIRQKIESNGWVENTHKLREFYDLFRRKVNTDIDLTTLLALTKIGMGIDYGDIVSAVLNDDPTQRGGLLYAPAREFYNGQFVLLPFSMADTQAFLDLVLIHPEVLLENAQIAVLNGTTEEGLASKTASQLRRLGFHVIEVGNHETETGNDVAVTFLEEAPIANTPGTKKFLEQFFDVAITKTSEDIQDESLIDLRLVLGN